MTPKVDSRRGGFSLIELLTTMIVIGILSGIAIPYLRDAVYRADARKVMTDVSAIRFAVMEFREDNGRLPNTASWGTTPPDLVPYLNNVDFVRYPRRHPVGMALRAFERPGRDSGTVTWNNRRSRFRLLERNQ